MKEDSEELLVQDSSRYCEPGWRLIRLREPGKEVHSSRERGEDEGEELDVLQSFLCVLACPART